MNLPLPSGTTSPKKGPISIPNIILIFIMTFVLCTIGIIVFRLACTNLEPKLLEKPNYTIYGEDGDDFIIVRIIGRETSLMQAQEYLQSLQNPYTITGMVRNANHDTSIYLEKTPDAPFTND